MNKLSILSILISLLFVFSSCDQFSPGESADLENELDSVSYAIGISVGKSLQTSGMDELNYAALSKGFEDALSDGEAEIDPMAANTIIQGYMQDLQTRKADENLEVGRAFLEENKAQENVQTTESGMQYIVLEEGTGPSPEPTDEVRVHYTGTTIDGTVFDSSVERGEPAVFVLNRVIPGWTEALQMMKVGGKWKIFLPTELAYGANPRPGGAIQPNEALIFEVELLEIIEQEATEE